MEQRMYAILRLTSVKIIVVVLQILVLLAIALSHYATAAYGEEIKLKTVPIDPRDMFYGDYVTLQYEISELPISLWKDENKPTDSEGLLSNTIVYVVIQPSDSADGMYQAQGFYTEKPAVSGNQLLLKGKVDYVNGPFTDDEKATVRIHYGIERFYVSENTGKELEEQSQKGEIIGTVKISKWSSPVLEKIEWAGKQ